MALSMLTPEVIEKICRSSSGQEEIAKLVKTMNSQGVTKMFINYEAVRKLVRRMSSDGICSLDMSYLTDEKFDETFIAYLTNKVIEFLNMVDRIEEKPSYHGLPMLKELTGYYLSGDYQPMKVFYWMSEFAISYKVEFDQIVDTYFTRISWNPDMHAMYKQLINDAIPMGINSEVHALAWVKANEEAFEKLDFTEILNAIQFDRYYFEVYEKNPEDKAACNAEGENDPWKFVPKSEIRRLADGGFKPLILDVVFQEAKSLSVSDINAAIKKLFKERPTLVYMLYARAMFFTKASEMQRFQKLVIQICDAEGIEYSLVPNQIDPRMFKENPWSGNFS